MKSIDKFIPILNQTSLRSIIVATFGAPIVFHGTVVFFKLTRLLLLRFKLRPRFSNKMMFDFNPSFEMQNIWSYRVQFLILLESGFFIWYIVMFRWLWGLQPHSRINIFARHWRYLKLIFLFKNYLITAMAKRVVLMIVEKIVIDTFIIWYSKESIMILLERNYWHIMWCNWNCK